jgi:hypothetical protein
MTAPAGGLVPALRGSPKNEANAKMEINKA